MTDITMNNADMTAAPNKSWLKSYYAVRAIFSIIWVALAFTVGKSQPSVGIALIIIYPAWDCLANYYDAKRSGGLGANPTQLMNVVVSAIVTLAVAYAATRDFHVVLGVVGLWAVLSGIFQLATAIRRRKSAGAQWPMILSGVQSALAGGFFVKMAFNAAAPADVTTVAGYAGFGAVYFAISALVLTFSRRR
jgi:uncharacterized membrane protein HdeD (DUF308 family)